MSVSVIINAHREGPLLLHSTASALQSLEILGKTNGANGELIVICDRSDDVTVQIAKSIPKVEVIETDFGDLGLSRNLGVANSSGDFIAFLDADDIWSENWLQAAYSRHLTSDRVSVYHPELNYFFGHGQTKNSRAVFRHMSSLDAEFSPYTLCMSNGWTALSAAHRSVYLKIPFEAVSEDLRNGFEDWTFNLRVLEAGLNHEVVPGTAHFIRDKPWTRMRSSHSARNAVFKPTKLWGFSERT